jgi:hypothetical protein
VLTVSSIAATPIVANPTVSNPARRNPVPTAVSMIGLMRSRTEKAKRDQPDLGAVSDEKQPAGQPGDAGIEAMRVGDEDVQIQGVAAVGAGVAGREIQQDGAQERHGDPD